MVRKHDGNWMNPQTVPRGFLRLYVLSLLSKGEERGYSIIQDIAVKSEGAWRPGPGTIYPLLKELQKDELIREVKGISTKNSVVTYAITPKGARALAEMQQTLVAAGKRERVMFKLFADLLSPPVMAQIYVRRQRESFEIFQETIKKLEPEVRQSILKELGVILEIQRDWLTRSK